MPIPTPVKKRRSRVKNASVKKDPSLLDSYIEKLKADQTALLADDCEDYMLISAYYGCSGTYRAPNKDIASRMLEAKEENGHAIARSYAYRGYDCAR